MTGKTAIIFGLVTSILEKLISPLTAVLFVLPINIMSTEATKNLTYLEVIRI
jgi:hypothetical protein